MWVQDGLHVDPGVVKLEPVGSQVAFCPCLVIT